MYEAYITTIKEIRKHSNADRLQCCTVFGNNVIVDLSYQLGQRVVYFPTDGQLSEEFAKDNNLLKNYVPISELDEKQYHGKQITNRDGIDCVNIGGYMEPTKRNITALKLRGEKSDGLLLPIECLAKYTDINTLKDGDSISVLNGHEICKKYIPARSRRTSTPSGGRTNVNRKELKEQISYPFFAEHIDTKQLAYNRDAFKPGDIIYLTQKLHGTSFRVGNVVEVTKKKRRLILKKVFKLKDKEIRQFKCISGTRRTTLRDYDGGFYGSNKFRQKYHDMFKDRLPKGMTIYGEIVGWIDDTRTIMPVCPNSRVKDKEFTKMYGKETVFSYGCKQGENDCYIYRITMTNEDGVVIELPTEETMLWCERLGAKYVPLLEKFLFTTWEDLNKRCEKYLDIPEPLANGEHVTEGVVVRIDNRSKFTAFKAKRFAFKVLEGIIKDAADAPDIEEAEELLSEDNNE